MSKMVPLEVAREAVMIVSREYSEQWSFTRVKPGAHEIIADRAIAQAETNIGCTDIGCTDHSTDARIAHLESLLPRTADGEVFGVGSKVWFFNEEDYEWLRVTVVGIAYRLKGSPAVDLRCGMGDFFEFNSKNIRHRHPETGEEAK